MRKVLITFLLTAAVALLVSPVNAVTWTYYDFGTNYFDGNDNYSPVFFPNGIGYLPSPGHTGMGGEAFDIEGINFAFDATYMYVTMTSSYGTGVWAPQWNRTFPEGDLFFGFDGSKYDYAIDVSEGRLIDVTAWNYIPVVPGGYGGNAIIRNAIGAYTIASGTVLGNVDQTYSFYLGLETNPLIPGVGDTYIKEYQFLLSDLGVDPMTKGSITFHATMECGNDLGEEDFGIVPEPGTMILLGVGLLGVGAHLRRRK